MDRLLAFKRRLVMGAIVVIAGCVVLPPVPMQAQQPRQGAPAAQLDGAPPIVSVATSPIFRRELRAFARSWLNAVTGSTPSRAITKPIARSIVPR